MVIASIVGVLAFLLIGIGVVFASACAWRDEAYGPCIFLLTLGFVALGTIALRLIDYKVKEEIQMQVQQRTEQAAETRQVESTREPQKEQSND